jgi:DNA-binding Lrp family transcriptional regulator
VASIDVTDLRLIRCLQENPRASYATIARITSLSETTVRRRVDALIQSGAIMATMLPALLPLGYAASAQVCLKLDLQHRDDVATALEQMPEITFAVATLGRYDVIFQVAQRTPQDLSDWLAARIAPLPGVREIEVMLITSAVKMFRHWRVPLDDSCNGPAPEHEVAQPPSAAPRTKRKQVFDSSSSPI